MVIRNKRFLNERKATSWTIQTTMYKYLSTFLRHVIIQLINNILYLLQACSLIFCLHSLCKALLETLSAQNTRSRNTFWSILCISIFRSPVLLQTLTKTKFWIQFCMPISISRHRTNQCQR